MAELQCIVENCAYNRETYCCKGDIMVGGKHADSEDDTCCESFAQRREGMDSYTSSLFHPSKVISIDCEAANCTYNNNYKCLADHVDIKGCGASDSKETLCSTFNEK